MSRSAISRRCKRGVSTTIDSLPDELLFDILLRLPAEEIHENARLVCRRWKRVIDDDAFAQAHLRRANYGLLISTGSHNPLTFIAATQGGGGGGGIEVSKLGSKSEYVFKASCNGMILMSHYLKDNIVYVFNPATRGCLKLPRFYGSYGCCYGMAYAAASTEYKVVATYCDFDSNNGYAISTKCAILTVGVDRTWRQVAIGQLSLKANQLLLNNPLITEGFMHWISVRNGVLTMNVEAEVFAETPALILPYIFEDRDKYFYTSTGRHLSVFIYRGKLLWEVREMKGDSREWRKVLPDIDLKGHESKIQQLAMSNYAILRPFGWVKYQEVLLFLFDHITSDCSFFSYNLVNHEIVSIEFRASRGSCKALVHKNSLVCLS